MSAYADRTVVVTGASGELGKAVSALLAAQGARLIAPARGGDRGVDLTDAAAVEKLYAGIPDLWASIHCAGGFAAGKIGDLTHQDLKRMLDTNTTSAFLCCIGAVAAMRRHGGGGRIVNVVSQQALDARRGAGMTPYAMSKAALAAMTVALAEELAPEGIWVNAVAPSIMDTAANRAAMPRADHARWPKVEEVAGVIGFLASPENRTARGALVPVYGRS